MSGGSSISVQSIRMRIDRDCSVDIERFDSGECDKTPASQSCTCTATIIGFTIVIVVLLIIVAVLIFALVRSRLHGNHKSEE